MGHRIAMGVEYDGSRFFGWQTQAQEPTVQSCLEKAISQVADTPVTVMGSGRTDTGVHARGQVIHFDTDAVRSRRSWLLGSNDNLPEDIAVTWCRQVSEDFDARFSATSRRYRYRILNRWLRPVLNRQFFTWIRQPLDAARMHLAGQCLVGEHDFGAFRSMRCQARHGVRRIKRFEVTRHADEITIEVEGNAFLHHMVRNLAGTLIEVGQAKREPAWVAELLAGRDRSAAGVTAPATGLCLEAVRYPRKFSIPERPDRPENLA
jgi:tRNA pseudouridine38-40 synthase